MGWACSYDWNTKDMSTRSFGELGIVTSNTEEMNDESNTDGKKVDYEDGWEENETFLGSCSIVGFGIISVETPCSTTKLFAGTETLGSKDMASERVVISNHHVMQLSLLFIICIC
jgi:hypothetical protein